jgi:hypothetical protein
VSRRIRDPESRRKRLGLKPDIDRKVLALKVFVGEPLEDHEREFVVRLVDPKMAAHLIKASPPKKKGRPPTTAAAVARDEIAEAFFGHKALWPHHKHKQTRLPLLAWFFSVSASDVEKAVRRTNPARRAEMESLAASAAKRYAKWLDTPRGVAATAEHERVQALMARAARASKPRRTK